MKNTASQQKTLPELIHYPQVDSTSRIAFDLGNRDAVHGTVVHATEQSSGRGRLSREFISPPGGLYMSAILRPRLPVQELPLATLAAGLACAEAVEDIAPVQVKLKWPNDLYVNHRKLGGILIEAAPYSHTLQGVPFIIVGIGLNVNTSLDSFPPSLQDFTSSLYFQTHQKYDIDILLQTLTKLLLSKVDILAHDKSKVLDQWKKRDYLLGKKICWQDPQGKKLYGSGKGLLDDGRYLLTTSCGEDYPVLAGDIIITQINGINIK